MAEIKTNIPVISSDGKTMTLTSPNENFILTVWGTAGTITVKRANSYNEEPVELPDTYEMTGTTDSINMVGFPFGCKITLVTTGTFTNADVDCGRA